MTTTDFPLPPEAQQGFWVWDKLHNPKPVAPLEQELLVESTGVGFSDAMAELGSTFSAVVRFFNYYAYLTLAPIDIGSEDREARLARYDKAANELMPKVGQLWDEEWLPAILPQLEIRHTDYSTLSEEELYAVLEKLRDDTAFRWTIHGYILYSFVAANNFAQYYAQVLGTEEQEGFEALQGFPSIALESSRGLWRLSRAARANPEVRGIFETSAPADILPKLNATDAGQHFLAQLSNYLEDFGWRTDSVYELRKPSWREDPSIPLNAIQGYVGVGDEGGPDSQYNRAVAQREKLLAEARAKLASEPEKLARFNELYSAAERFTPISEDHNHYIDQMGDLLPRYPALELGRRLVAKGRLTHPDDIFYLYMREIRGAIDHTDQRQLVATRRAEMERFGQVVPPPAIGVPPPPSNDPIEYGVIVPFFGTPVEPSLDPSVITGRGASPGTARGRAKVVRDLAEASKVTKGDVLVCEMTLPPWTPLFATVSAVVADTGGILSHCAIVAREYRIPCVVGTGVGTAVLKDGMMLTVDGTKGVVRIESQG